MEKKKFFLLSFFLRAKVDGSIRVFKVPPPQWPPAFRENFINALL